MIYVTRIILSQNKVLQAVYYDIKVDLDGVYGCSTSLRYLGVSAFKAFLGF